jgi:hypothetical protein
MKRSFRVGTVLTGAASCAAAFTPAVALTPAAAAQDTVVREPRPAAITELDCPENQGNYRHYVHLYWAAHSDHGPTCIGGKGTRAVDHSFVGFCAGNNSGWMTYLTPDGGHVKLDYYSESGIRELSHGSAFYVISVNISRWHSTTGCPY